MKDYIGIAVIMVIMLILIVLFYMALAGIG